MEEKKYRYRVSIWGGFYRIGEDELPEQYEYLKHEWLETDDAFEAFYKPGSSDYTMFTLGYFIENYYDKYINSKTSDEQLQNPIFLEMCKALGFKDEDYIGIGKKINEDYPGFFDDSEHLKKYIDAIEDYHVLGTAILIQWRQLTYWTYTGSILNNDGMPDAREWFIIAFSRLADINNQMIDEGKFTSWRRVKK